MLRHLRWPVLLICCSLVLPANAAILLSAPPRETPEEGKKIYGPVARHLSAALGTRVEYKHPGSWGVYQAYMQKNKYDIVFDGPHFVAWRMARSGHVPVARLPGGLSFVVVTARNKSAPEKIKDLAGRKVCGLAPPNLATLSVYAQFRAGREPYLNKTESFRKSFEGLMAGDCVAAVLRDVMIKRFDKDGKSKVLMRTKALPNQAFTVSQKLGNAMVGKIRDALVGAEGARAFPDFVKKYSRGKALESVERQTYEGLEVLLKDFWGFN